MKRHGCTPSHALRLRHPPCTGQELLTRSSLSRYNIFHTPQCYIAADELFGCRTHIVLKSDRTAAKVRRLKRTLSDRSSSQRQQATSRSSLSLASRQGRVLHSMTPERFGGAALQVPSGPQPIEAWWKAARRRRIHATMQGRELLLRFAIYRVPTHLRAPPHALGRHARQLCAIISIIVLLDALLLRHTAYASAILGSIVPWS